MLMLLLLSGCPAAGTNQLSAEVTQQGKNLQIAGKSDLPDQALILISLLDPAKPEAMNRNVIVQEFAQVKAGGFSAELKPTQPVPPGKYRLRLRFAPDSYDPSKGVVLQAVGAKGEHLTGPQVVSEGDVKMLVSTQEIEYKP
ncbi:MAG TPA: hypothetical protein V6D23_14475 [Candidatus Obscuribacterales bacterium]